jgi:hypothetical protein
VNIQGAQYAFLKMTESQNQRMTPLLKAVAFTRRGAKRALNSKMDFKYIKKEKSQREREKDEARTNTDKTRKEYFK